MKDHLKRGLGLLLVLSTAVMSQALCPMMLFPQLSQTCKARHNATPRPAASEVPGHRCCPPHAPKPAGHEQDPPATVTDCSSAMSCCSVEPPPAKSSRVIAAGMDLAVVGRIFPQALMVPGATSSLGMANAAALGRDVLSFKDDFVI